MIRLVPLMLLVLAACDGPLEELWPRRDLTFDHAGRSYDVRTQFDPLQGAWFTRIWSPGSRLEADDREAVFYVVQQMVGPLVCKDGRLSVTPGPVWSRHGAKKITYLPKIGQWQLVGTCT